TRRYARAGRALKIGQSAFDFTVNLFVMLCILVFLLRDGDALVRRIGAAVPLRGDHQRALVTKFTAVIRATVRGAIAGAAVQGLLGGLISWCWASAARCWGGVVMVLLSLLPAVGAAMVW